MLRMNGPTMLMPKTLLVLDIITPRHEAMPLVIKILKLKHMNFRGPENILEKSACIQEWNTSADPLDDKRLSTYHV